MKRKSVPRSSSRFTSARQSSSSGILKMSRLLMFLFVISRGTQAYRWETSAGFSTTDPFTSESDCERLKFLTPQQRKICQRHLDFMEAVREGAREALEECRHQFRNSRWNCSTFDSKDSFGGIMKTGSKETAFIYSILSAGVTQSVARACSSGRLKKCGCDRTLSGMSAEGFEWTGCSDNVAYGSAFALKFLDSREYLRKNSLIPRALVNLHNNNVGRKAVEKHMRIQCKCHGVSGSCEVKTCWKTLPDFRTVGDELRSKYDNSMRVMISRDGSHTELIPADQYIDRQIDLTMRRVENKNKNNNQRNKNRTEKRKQNNKGKKTYPTTSTSVFVDKLSTTTTTTSTPLATTIVTTNNFTQLPEVESSGLALQKHNKMSRFKRLSDDENQQKQKKNKVWISHGRDSRKLGNNNGNDNNINKNGNRIEKTNSEVQKPRNQELGRFPRVPVESKKEKTQQSHNRRLKDEMEQRRQLQRKRRERKIRRQRQQLEEELRFSENATPFFEDQHHLSRRRLDGNHGNHRVGSNHHYMPKTTFYHNKSSQPKENEDSFDQQMVFLDLSPDYCNSDRQTGSLGTQGRTCSIDGTEGNCSVLCCGRGYSVRRSSITERCNCRFQWCCEVKCMKCRREIVEYTCR